MADEDARSSEDGSAGQLRIGVGDPVAVEAGPLCFHVRRREVGSDGGISIELYRREDAEAAEPSRELVRFDLFRDDPHFHVPAPAAPKPIGRDEAPTPLDFAAERIGELAALLREAGFEALAEEVAPLDAGAIARAVCQAATRAPEPSEWSTFELTPEMRARIAGRDH